ncbi:MAG: hypothetical protein OEZ47_17510, partial [Gammaproteobacteria bacterium]|nr:hypothetical protein [Gammaproteobacteria bacterium]
RDKSFTPWLWFFVPYFVLAQPFALPRFVKAWNSIGKMHGLKPWNAWKGAWYLCCVVATALSHASDKIEFPGWLTLLVLLFWCWLLICLQRQVFLVKQKLENVTFYGSERNYSKVEWAFFAPASALVGVGLFIIALQPLFFTHLKSFSSGDMYTNQEHSFQFPIVGDGWSVVEQGTHSDGSAVVEFQGRLLEMWFIVFSQGNDSDSSSISRIRFDELFDESDDFKCQENREFVKNSLSIFTKITCEQKIFEGKELYTFSYIETENGLYELYGYLSTTDVSFATASKNMKAMAKGFSPL